MIHAGHSLLRDRAASAGDQTDQESRSAGHRAAPSMSAMDITTTKGASMTGSSTEGITTVLHPVSDLATAKEVYAWPTGTCRTSRRSWPR